MWQFNLKDKFLDSINNFLGHIPSTEMPMQERV